MAENAKGINDDPRAVYSHKMLKEALLELVAQQPLSTITAKSVCDRAKLSRGTFYRHFPNVEAVAGEAIEDSIAEIRAMLSALGLAKPEHAGNLTAPFCQYIRKSSHYRALYMDDTAEPLVMAKLVEASRVGFAAKMSLFHGMSPQQAEAVARFQAKGCIALCKQYETASEEEWREVLRAIDTMMHQKPKPREGGRHGNHR